jgi:hypothetical protein
VEIGRRTTLGFFAIYVGLVALRTLVPLFLDEPAYLITLATRGHAPVRGGRVLGLVPAYCRDQVRCCFGTLRWIGLFFLHAAHYPLLTELKSMLWPLLPGDSDVWMLAHYLATPSPLD